MTKPELEARPEQLKKEQKQTEQNFHAYAGAIQECQYWLSQAIIQEQFPKKENQ